MANPGEGPALLFLDQTEARRDEKQFFGDDLVVWCESSGLIFHQSKCKYQCITCKKSPIQSTYIINETPVESRNTEKGLYVWVTSNLASDTQGGLRWPEPIYLRGGYVFESRFPVGMI